MHSCDLQNGQSTRARSRRSNNPARNYDHHAVVRSLWPLGFPLNPLPPRTCLPTQSPAEGPGSAFAGTPIRSGRSSLAIAASTSRGLPWPSPACLLPFMLAFVDLTPARSHDADSSTTRMQPCQPNGARPHALLLCHPWPLAPPARRAVPHALPVAACPPAQAGPCMPACPCPIGRRAAPDERGWFCGNESFAVPMKTTAHNYLLSPSS